MRKRKNAFSQKCAKTFSNKLAKINEGNFILVNLYGANEPREFSLELKKYYVVVLGYKMSLVKISFPLIVGIGEPNFPPTFMLRTNPQMGILTF
ncbi:hypothetical protein HMPREF3222_02507 [Clostridium perfringens]|uniref:Uncharacterized protein n=1 Tax=Clostridium perfringens TaxID=1502 RepID=A0A133MVH8_CLOPF|nr:hypothetical protein HMPREF3222_02507 [Clostridium perfringens]